MQQSEHEFVYDECASFSSFFQPSLFHIRILGTSAASFSIMEGSKSTLSKKHKGMLQLQTDLEEVADQLEKLERTACLKQNFIATRLLIKS